MREMLLQDYSDDQADKRPEAIALVDNGNRVTYAELAAHSNRLAHMLEESGCRPGDRIGLLLPKSADAVISMLGTLKAGCIYVPLDTSSPASRLELIVRSSGARFLLASDASLLPLQRLIGTLQSADEIETGWIGLQARPEGCNVVFDRQDWSAASSGRLSNKAESSSVAHILFTSGSTGRPKGVMITHENVMHFVDWAIRYFRISPDDRISGHPPLHFDLSTFDVYGTFAAGAQLHLVPPQLNLLPHKMAEFIRGAELTQWFSVPSLLSYMAKFDVVRWNDFPRLQRLLWCGESFPTPSLIYWMKRLPHVSFTNLYGPTEATIASSYHTVPQCPNDATAPTPIGVGCDGEQLLVLDEDMTPSLPGQIGDLYIGGVGLSPGYWNDPEKTKSAFLPNPFSAEPDRIYKTGDLASVGKDGLVYLHGRADSQIKSRGYRIELGDIEAALHATPGVRECAVVAIDTDGFEGAVICCSLVPEHGFDFDPRVLRQQLSQQLPQYMLPSHWIPKTALPLNGNGKVDRPKLREEFRQLREVALTTSSDLTRNSSCLERLPIHDV